MNQKKKLLEKKPHKVVVIGDSHARGCAAVAKKQLNNDYEVFGFVVLGGGGGSKDIARNNATVGMKHILEFLINANNKNVILMSAPHRHDLIRNSWIHSIRGSEKKFEKVSKRGNDRCGQ
jgi:hypothetical protein